MKHTPMEVHKDLDNGVLVIDNEALVIDNEEYPNYAILPHALGFGTNPSADRGFSQEPIIRAIKF